MKNYLQSKYELKSQVIYRFSQECSRLLVLDIIKILHINLGPPGGAVGCFSQTLYFCTSLIDNTISSLENNKDGI